MDKKRAIELLKQAVDEIPHLKTLHYQNDEIKLWLDKVGNMLRAGLKPEDYSKYWPVFQALEILKGVYEDNIYQEEYLKKVTNYEIALKSILLKYEVVGMEGKRDKGGEVERMDRQKTIEFLKQKSKEAVYVASLPYNNNEYLPWRRNIEDILESAFGVTSTEYRRVADVQITLTKGTRAELQRAYVRKVHRIQQEVDSIIQKYEQLKIEEKPAITTEAKDTMKSPIQLFDAMQFHPKIIQASKSLFENKHYAQAIFEAFKAVENFVQDKSGISLYGSNLMEKVFNEENPVIKVPEAGYYYKDVQRGFKNLFIGAAQGIRNPKAHKEIIQKDPYITLQYLGFASFLLKRIDYWEVDIS